MTDRSNWMPDPACKICGGFGELLSGTPCDCRSREPSDTEHANLIEFCRGLRGKCSCGPRGTYCEKLWEAIRHGHTLDKELRRLEHNRRFPVLRYLNDEQAAQDAEAGVDTRKGRPRHGRAIEL